jgi:Stage II sporulation protein E (SpoIIE)
MMINFAMRRYFGLWLVLAAGVSARGQSNSFPEPGTTIDPSMASGAAIDLTAHEIPVTDLARAMWRFHPGDDAAWAGAGFDDSGWPLLRGYRAWDSQGFLRLGGYGWYRIHLKVPAGRPLAFAPGFVFDNFQVFANGRLLATWGDLNPGSVPLYGETTWGLVVQIPADLTSTGDVVVALRVYHDLEQSNFRVGGFGPVPKLIGPPAAVAVQADLLKSLDMVRWTPRVLIFSLTVLAGILSLLLYLRERRSSEYLWFAIYQVTFGTGYLWLFATRHWFPMLMTVRDGLDVTLQAIAVAASVVFFFRFTGERISRWARWLLYVQVPVFLLGWLIRLLLPEHLSLIVLLNGANHVAVHLTILWLIFSHWRRSKAARRLALPMILIALASIAGSYAAMLYALGITGSGIGGRANLFHQPFELTYLEAAQIVFLAAMAYVLTERFAETQREKSRLAGEFEAAKTVQQLLIPDVQPEVAGLAIESVYLPALEVGGDFFQVIPVSGCGAIVAIGDVSGHGLQAAMTVSLVVGAMRTLAESEGGPAQVLAGLNRLLYGRGAGFTTCLVLHIGREGQVTAANAGHLAPYLDGVEMVVETGLPLGFALEVDYGESFFTLEEGSMLTLLTDGVVEAANERRELFGFERTQAVSAERAQEIVAAAQAFQGGAVQADDMTVLRIVRGVVVD